jgi:hypothetical protein
VIDATRRNHQPFAGECCSSNGFGMCWKLSALRVRVIRNDRVNGEP